MRIKPRISLVRTLTAVAGLLLALSGTEAIAGCQTLSSGNGNWNNKNNWDCGRVPTASDDVTVNNAITNIGGDAYAKSLTLNASVTDSGNSTLTVSGEFTNNSSFSASRLTVIVTKEFRNNGSGMTVSSLTVGDTLTNNGSLTATTLNAAGDLTNNSSFTVTNLNFTGSGTQQVAFYGSSSQIGNLTVAATSRVSSSSWSTLTLTGNLTVSGSLSLTNSTLIFGGSSAQTTSGNAFSIRTLQINNAAGLTLGQSVTASNSLSLSRGVIDTGSNTLYVSNTCDSAISGGSSSSYVNGRLRLSTPAWGSTCTWPVGDASTYAPVSVTFPWFIGISGGSLTAYTTSGAHPNLGSSGIDASKNVNRYWTLGASGDTLTSLPLAGSYSVSLQFAAGDVSSGATVSAMQMALYSGSAWTTLSGSASGTTATGSGFTAFGSFAVGQAGVSVPMPKYEYRMDETGWTGTSGEVRDTQTALNGTAAGSATTTSSGKICNAGRFTTSTNYVTLGRPTLGLTNQITVSTWMNWQISPSSGNSWANLFTFNSASATDSGVFWLQHSQTNGVPEFAVQTSNGRQYVQASTATAQNQWQHVVGVYDGSRLTIYVNGAAVGSTTHSGNLSSPPADAVMTIGRWAYSGNNYRQFNGYIDETKLFSTALSASQVAALYGNEVAGKNWDGSARTCASSAPGALNAVDTGDNAVSGIIGTKTAGSGFNLDVYALNAGRSAQDSSFSGSVLVDLMANTSPVSSLDSQNCPASGTSISVGTATLSSGRGSIAVPAVADAWRDVRVRLRYPAIGTATVTACSADNFAVKPSYLAIQASDSNWTTAGSARSLGSTSAAGGSYIHKAGQPFTLTATAYNASNVVTANYAGTPTAGSLTAVTGSVTGSLTTGSFSGSGGTVSSATASYDDAGTISLQFQDTGFASVDASDGTAAGCSGYYACSSAVTLGRFVPDHFALTSGSATPACGSFTYYGQDGVATRFTLTAQNAANSTTRNYAGSVAQLSLSSYANLGFSVTGLPGGVSLSSGASAPTGSWSAGVASGVTATHIASRAASASAVSSGAIYATPTDLDGVSVASATLVASTPFRYGRVRFANGAGSELLDLNLPMKAEYWDASANAWTFNSADTCTTTTLSFAAVGSTDITSRTCVRDALGASGSVACNASPPTGRQFMESGVTGFGGDFNVWLKAPGASYRGAIDVTAAVQSWLQYNWTGSVANPKARATFGVFKSGPVIYLREAF